MLYVMFCRDVAFAVQGEKEVYVFPQRINSPSAPHSLITPKESIAMNVVLTPVLERFVHEQVRLGKYVNASEVVRDAIRRMMEESEQQSGPQSESADEDNSLARRVLLDTVEDIYPGKKYRIGMGGKQGHLLRITGSLDGDDETFVGVTVKLENYERRWKETAWFFFRELRQGEIETDFPLRDERDNYENVWWWGFKPLEIENKNSVYEFDLIELTERIRQHFEKYSHLRFKGISTFQFGKNADVISISIYQTTREKP